jgi:hypothetical protein
MVGELLKRSIYSCKTVQMLLKKFQSIIGCTWRLSSWAIAFHFIYKLSWTSNSEVGISMFAGILKIFKTITVTTNVDTLSGWPLTKVDIVKDLWVLLDSKLTFNANIKYWCNKALKMLGFLFRIGQDFRNLRSLKIIYFVFVRSHLEYCCQVWNSSEITTIA